MNHAVFVSYSSKDKDVARTLVSAFDQDGVRCWLAERDVPASADFTLALTQALDTSRLVILLLSHNASSSIWVRREIARAIGHDLPILPVRIDDSPLDEGMDFMLSLNQRFDAFDGPIEHYLEELTTIVQGLLGVGGGSGPANHDAAGGLEELKLDPAEAEQAQRMADDVPFAGVISRTRPACVLFVVDQSFSMNEPVAGTGLRKKAAVAETVNRLIYSMVLAATKESGIRSYFDVGIFRYGVDAGVDSVFDPELIGIAELAENPLEWAASAATEAGGLSIEYPIWFKPYAKGKTLTREAFIRALDVAKGWTAAHPDSFPPIVLHITDGGFDRRRDDPTRIVRELQDQNTSIGGTLVFNCHLSSKVTDEAISYPGQHAAQELDPVGRSLFDISSPLPQSMRDAATAFGMELDQGARGYVRNANLDDLIKFLDIGTRVVSVAARRA